MSLVYPKHIRFRCQRCALCRRDTEHKIRLILLLKTETENIHEKTLMSFDEFAEKIDGFEPYLYVTKKTEDGDCIFLRNESCSIYKVRPLIYRFHPFQLHNLRNNQYGFTYTNECPNIGKGPRLKRSFFQKMLRIFIETVREDVETESAILLDSQAYP